MLERLPFQLPEFLRVAWASAAARDYWEPKIQAVSQVWPLVERATVERTLRPGALQTVSPEQLLDLQQWSLRSGIPMAIVGMEGAHGSYGNASIPYRPGAPFAYRVYFGRGPTAFLEAWQDGDNAAIGVALGFPDCCVRFFDQYWRQEGWRDLTYPAIGDSEAANLVRHTNVLLKPLGVRPVFHLPCSFVCQSTYELGEDILALMEQVFPRESAWLQALVSMPMEWSSLHGVAMVVTPILKLVYASDPLPSKVTFHLVSNTYPEHGARGTQFPFSTVSPMRLIRPRSLNGFSSLDAMERGHRFVLGALPELTGAVVDLGCGDGTLMRAIQHKCPEATVHGVEVQADFGTDDPRIVVADLFAWPWGGHYQCVLLAMQRVLEVPRVAAVELLATIRQHAAMVLLYSYDGAHPEIDPFLAPFRIKASHVDGTHAAFLLEGT